MLAKKGQFVMVPFMGSSCSDIPFQSKIRDITKGKMINKTVITGTLFKSKEFGPKNSSSISGMMIKAPRYAAAILPMREYLLLPFRCSVKGIIATAGGAATPNIINPFQISSSYIIIALIPKRKPVRTI